MRDNMRKTDAGGKEHTLCRHMKYNFHRYLMLAAVLLGAAIIWAAVPLSFNAINNEKNNLFAEPWQYSINDGDFRSVTLPDSESTSAGSRITLKNQLPSEVIKGATVLLRTSQQDAAVFVDGEKVYSSYDMENNTPAPSSAYHFVRLPTDCAGKEITVILSSPYENYAGLVNQIYIGSKASNVFFLLGENGFRMIIGFLVFSVGFLLMVMFSLAKGQENKASIICLGAFFVCAGYWVMVESKIMQFLFPYPVALTNSSIFALSLLPVFSGLYYYNTHTRLLRKAGKYVVAIVAAASLLFSIAACVNPTLPLFILPHYLVFMGLYLVALFASILVESIKAGNFFSTSVCGVIAFSICCLLELIFYFANMKGYNNSNFLTLGLLLFCVFMVIDSIGNFARVYRDAVKVNALSVLAYTDSLTNLKNRTAFLESLSMLDPEREPFVSMAMFDINNLKLVNDTLGHLVGDALLRHCAKAIQNSLRRGDELYRVGGDEFVAIIRHRQTLDFEVLANRLVEIIARENQKPLSCRLSIAYGYATFSKGTDKTLFETLSRADEAMYARKKIQKSKFIGTDNPPL